MTNIASYRQIYPNVPDNRESKTTGGFIKDTLIELMLE
jgi:hypothetical protein